MGCRLGLLPSLRPWMHDATDRDCDRRRVIESRLFCLSSRAGAAERRGASAARPSLPSCLPPSPSFPHRRSLICPVNKVEKTATRGAAAGPSALMRRRRRRRRPQPADGLNLEMSNEYLEEGGGGNNEIEVETPAAPAAFPRPTTLNCGRLLT